MSRSPATCVLSDTSSWMAANLPPSATPAALCAAEHSATTFCSASARRASRTTFAPPCQSAVSIQRMEARTRQAYLGEEHCCCLVDGCSGDLSFTDRYKRNSYSSDPLSVIRTRSSVVWDRRKILTALAPVITTVFPSKREALKTDMTEGPGNGTQDSR